MAQQVRSGDMALAQDTIGVGLAPPDALVRVPATARGGSLGLSLCATHPVLGGVLGGLGLAISATTAFILYTDVE